MRRIHNSTKLNRASAIAVAASVAAMAMTLAPRAWKRSTSSPAGLPRPTLNTGTRSARITSIAAPMTSGALGGRWVTAGMPSEARNRISTKVAFQYSVLPVAVQDGSLEVAVSNPFDPAMLNAVRFDAHGQVRFALATKVEIEKALKKY